MFSNILPKRLHVLIITLKRLLRRFNYWQPLTFRGLLAVGLAIIGLVFLAIPQKDLVAYMLSGSIIGLLVTIFILNILLWRRLKPTLLCDIFFDAANCYAEVPIPCGMNLKNSSISPFFEISIKRIFEHRGASTFTHIVREREPSPQKRTLIDSIIFPHRGNWRVTHIHCTVGDTLGFIRLAWDVPIDISLNVSPQIITIKPLPIIASSSRSGDLINLSDNRAGDLYDLKPYDPSDGVSRILWKTYAKSGQLVVRKPEPAILPEGELVLYLVANKNEDYVAGALRSYLDYLIDNNIVVWFGTDGSDKVLSNVEEIINEINSTVWNQNAGTGKDFQTFVSNLLSNNRPIHQTIVFGPTRQNYIGEMKQISERSNITLHQAAIPEDIIVSGEAFLTLP